MHRIAPFAASLLLLYACAETPERVEIAESRELAPHHRSEIPDLTSAERLGLQATREHQHEPRASTNPFVWSTPAGWEELPPTQFRMINLRITAHPDAQCYLTSLGGDGGGVFGNVNRWRGQMGLPPISREAIEELPRRSLLGQEAVFLELDGDYAGMRPDASGGQETDWRMYAALLQLPARMLTVKMTGPRSVLEAQREQFESFLASIRFQQMGSAEPKTGTEGPKPVGPAGQAASGATKSPQNIRWTAPEHWKSGRTSSMRLATFHPDGDEDFELSIITLAGDAGGLVPNVQRWYGQLGVAAPSPEQVADLPKIDVLGVKGTLIEQTGSYAGMGSTGKPGYMMLGLIAQPAAEFSLYLKMTGPEAKVRAEKDAFLAFCKSLRFEDA